VLAHPASVDSVPTSGGKEDHVSMGMTSALKLRQIVENAEFAVAIELMVAAEGLRYRLPLQSSKPIRRAIEIVRGFAPPLAADRALSKDIQAQAIKAGELDEFV